MSEAHASAILDRLRSGVPALTVHDGKVPAGTSAAATYVVVYFTVVTPTAELAPDKVDLSMDSDVIDLRAYCHSVSGTAAGARIVAGRVRGRLLNWTPTVTGRECFPMRHYDNFQVDRDEQSGADVYDVVDVYRLVTVPG